MKNLKALILSLSFAFLTNQSLLAATITPGKAAELAAHKLEHLANTGKIDESFLTKFSNLEIIKLEATNPADPAFKVIASQFAGANGIANKIELTMNAAGKTLSQTVVGGPEAQNAPVWEKMEALTYAELAFHFIEDSTSEEVKPFVTGLVFVKLKQLKNDQGEVKAKVELTSALRTNVLEILMNEDGSVESVKSIQ